LCSLCLPLCPLTATEALELFLERLQFLPGLSQFAFRGQALVFVEILRSAADQGIEIAGGLRRRRRRGRGGLWRRGRARPRTVPAGLRDARRGAAHPPPNAQPRRQPPL